MELRLYNTLTKTKDVFKPLKGNEVRIYSCGPTVYKDATIGNMRTYIFMDVLRRVLKYNGYTLKHAMNITDVGHLVSDSDEGEDKMIKSAKEEGKTPLQIAQIYTKRFMKDLNDLNIDMPEIICKATDHITDMVEFVKGLVEKGYAYETSSAIYFDVSKLDKYGILSGIDLIPTHHENEIAQSKGLTGKIPAKLWMHGEYLLIDGGKMSKSLGNVYLLSDIVKKGFSPLAYKMFCFSASYRNKINFTWDGIEASNKSLIKLKEAYKKHLEGTEEVSVDIISKFEEKFHEAINDDLNMPLAMSVVWEVARYQQKSKKIAELLLKFDTVLGIKINELEEKIEEIPQEILELVEKRKIARKEKNWELSDKIRDEISKKGYNLKDLKDDIVIEKITRD